MAARNNVGGPGATFGKWKAAGGYETNRCTRPGGRTKEKALISQGLLVCFIFV